MSNGPTMTPTIRRPVTTTTPRHPLVSGIRVTSKRIESPLFNILDPPQLPIGFCWIPLGECWEGSHHTTRPISAPLQIPSPPNGNPYLALVYRGQIQRASEFGEGFGDLDGLLRPLYDWGVYQVLLGEDRTKLSPSLLYAMGIEAPAPEPGLEELEKEFKKFVSNTAFMLSKYFPAFRRCYGAQVTDPFTALEWAKRYPEERDVTRAVACTNPAFADWWKVRWENKSRDDANYNDHEPRGQARSLIFDLLKTRAISTQDFLDALGVETPGYDLDDEDP